MGVGGGEHEGEEVAVESAGLGSGGRCRDLPRRQAVEVLGPAHLHGELVAVGLQGQLEGGLEAGQLLVERPQPVLVVVAEGGTRQSQLRQVALDEVGRLRVEVLPRRGDLLQPGPQRRVEPDGVTVGSQPGSEGGPQRVDGR